MVAEGKQLPTSYTNWWLGQHLVTISSSAFAHLTLHSPVYVQTVLCCCFLFRAKEVLGSWGKRQKKYRENCTIYIIVCPFTRDPCENNACWWSREEENKSWFPFLQAHREAGARLVTCCKITFCNYRRYWPRTVCCSGYWGSRAMIIQISIIVSSADFSGTKHIARARIQNTKDSPCFLH